MHSTALPANRARVNRCRNEQDVTLQSRVRCSLGTHVAFPHDGQNVLEHIARLKQYNAKFMARRRRAEKEEERKRAEKVKVDMVREAEERDGHKCI